MEFTLHSLSNAHPAYMDEVGMLLDLANEV